MRKRRRDGTDDDGLAQECRCHSCLSSFLHLSPASSSSPRPPPAPSPFSSSRSVIHRILLSLLSVLSHIRWTSYLGPLRSAPHHLRLLASELGVTLASFLSAITVPIAWLPTTSLVTFSPLLLFALLSPYSSSQARLATNSPLANSLCRQSILLSSYFLLTTTTSTLVAAESISPGLHLNSFIPHFEPLYYDRHQLLHQYTRLKRSLSEKQTKVKQFKAPRKPTSRRRRRDTTSSLGPFVISNRSDSDTRPLNGTDVRAEDGLLLSPSGMSANLSTASTTAFFRHNCPMPNHDHHLEDSTEKVLLKQTAASSSTATLDHSTGADNWLLYDDHNSDSSNADETDPDTDASIDIVDDGHIDAEDASSDPNLVLLSHAPLPGHQQYIHVEFTAHNRLFRLQLHSNSERVFAQNPVFETSAGKHIHYDTSNVLRGHLEDDEDAIFEGIITRDGLLDGHLTTRYDEFYIEPAHRYFPATKEGNAHDFHSVIYSTSTVNFPNATHGSASPFSGSKFMPLLNPFRGYYNRWLDDLDQWDLMANIEEILHGRKVPSKRRAKRASTSSAENSAESLDGTTDQPVWTSFGTRNQSRVNGSKDTLDFEKHYKAGQKKFASSSSTSSTLRMPSKAEHFRKASVSSKSAAGGPSGSANGGHEHGGRYWRDMDSLHYTESEPYGIKAVHPRTHWIDDQARHHDRHVVVDPKKTTCMLYLQADHLFFEKMGSEEACIESMTRHVQKVNNIYKNTDFDQDGRPDNISFLIKRIKVHTLESLKDSEYRYPNTYGVEKFLELFSEEDYDAFCLAYMFTYRDFEGGTLGLAWTGDLKNAGGVCEKNGHYRGSLKSLNTGIVTLLNYGKHVPPIVSHVTLAHEIGHNFGSPHDPEDDHACTPGGENGNYIMFARATSGDKRNNNKFSPCSLRSINAVLNTKAKSLKGCFQEPQDAICGNEVVEEGEECDCGWEEDCKEPCCFPMRANPPPDEPPCKLRPNVICSPSQGPCCTQDCKLKVGNKCRDDNGCRTASYCNGQGPQCPPSTNKANKTICNDEYVCYMGECTGSICMAYGLESCQCKQGPNDLPTKLCELCCRMPSDDSTCKSSFEWNTTPYDVPDLFSKPGTPCDNYNGYCDNGQRCREVDPSSPLATLRRLFLSNESMASLKRWFNEQWFYVAVLIMISVLILLMAYKVFNNRRTGGLTKTDIMEVALEAVAKHQQEQAQQQAQAQAQQSQNSSATQSTANGSDSVSQASNGKETKGTSSANSTASPTSSTTLNTSASASTQSTVVTSSTSSSSSVTSTKTTTSALISTPSQQHNHGTGSNSTSSTNVSLQPKNSIDSQHSLLDNNNSVNSYGFNTTSAANGMDSSYSGSMSSYIPPQTSQSSTVQPKVSQSYLTATASVESSASLYGTMKSTSAGHHNHPAQQSSYYGSKHSSTTASAQSTALMSLQQQTDANGNLYNHPFSGTGHGGSLYGYTRGQGQGLAVGHHHHHHHSIPSLYQPSMIYQQQPVVAPGQLAPQQQFYDPSALAIVANQPTYGTTTNQGYHLAEQTYGQAYYYPASGSRQLNYHTASTYYQSSSLYDYIPFPRPVNPSTTAPAKPPPLPSMATHPTQIHQHQTSSSSTHKNRSIDLTNTLDTRRLYSSSLEVPGYKDSANTYYDNSGSGQSGDKGHHHHHYYYQQFYGAAGSGAATNSGNSSSSKFAQHYGTIHRGSTTSASSLTHHNHLPNAHSGNAGGSAASGTSTQQASRHYQHYYPHQLHASGAAHHLAAASSTSSHSRQHHSSHPQLLNTTSLSVPRASPSSGVTPAVAVEPTYGTHHSSGGSSRRSHQQIYEPLATLPLNSIGPFGYPLEHSGSVHHSSNTYYSTRSDVFASHHESLPPMGGLPGGGSGLHHSNSFHGHLDDFDLIAANSRSDDAVSDSNVGMSSSGHKHSKSHGSSGWV